MTQELTPANHALAERPNPFQLTTFEAVEKMATYIAESGMYGIKKPAQAITMMMMAHEEGITVVQLMRRVHVFEDGKISQRADWTQAEFEKHGSILWHVRNDEAAAATLFLKKELTDEDRDRASARCELVRQLDDLRWTDPRDTKAERKVEAQISKLARAGEETVLRTAQNIDARGVSLGKGGGTKANWATSPESMLQWRVITAGVKVVAPFVLAGMASEIELQDARDYERQEKARIANTPTISQDDVPAILGMIEQYDAELATDIPDGRRKTLQGLRSDLVCKLGDIGVKPPAQPEAPAPTVGGVPAKTVEATVLPPETPAQPAKATRTRKPATPAAAPEDNLDMTPTGTTSQPPETPWREFVCLRGKVPGSFNGNTLGHIFLEGRLKADDEAKLEQLVNWFVQQAIPTSTDPNDKLLWAKVQEAAAEVRAGFSAGSPEIPASAKTTPAAQKPVQQPASPTRWQDFVIPGKHPLSGKKLGEISSAEVKAINDDFLVKIDWSRATLSQKSLKANIALAMAELFPGQNAEPEKQSGDPTIHIKALIHMIQSKGWDAGFFLSTCKINGWITEDHRKVEDITKEEFDSLTGEWEAVEKEIDAAHQPARQP